MGGWQHIYNRVSMAERLLEYKRTIKIIRQKYAKHGISRMGFERHCIRYTKPHQTGRGLRRKLYDEKEMR